MDREALDQDFAVPEEIADALLGALSSPFESTASGPAAALRSSHDEESPLKGASPSA
jgi:hypothetical protein